MKRRTKPLKRTPLRRVSKKRAKENRVYSQLRATFLHIYPYCQANLPPDTVFCTHFATDVHHIAKRGPKLNDMTEWIGVCRNCHDWIHSHANEARKLGLLK